MITLKNISKSYGSNKVLKNINLSFEKGKVYGVVGKNGAGKTTLFSCIAGLEQHKGTIIYKNGILKNVTGFLPTSPFFMSKITGYEYLRLFCTARGIDFKKSTVSNIFNLPLENYAETYSTGMKKKLALQAILLQKNDIFILDEPFSGIDIESNVLLTQILEILKSRDKIIIISSHIFSILQSTCDVLHYLENGEINKTVTKNNFSLIENEMKNKEIDFSF